MNTFEVRVPIVEDDARATLDIVLKEVKDSGKRCMVLVDQRFEGLGTVAAHVVLTFHRGLCRKAGG